MNDNFNLQEYLTKDIENFMKSALKATLKNPRESAFMLKFAAATKAASKRREALEKQGEHVPSFMIASITSKCNLHCAGILSKQPARDRISCFLYLLMEHSWTRSILSCLTAAGILCRS